MISKLVNGNFCSFILLYAVARLAIVFSIDRIKDLPSAPLAKEGENLVADVALAFFAGVWTLSSLVFYSSRSVDGNLRVILFLPSLPPGQQLSS